VKAGGMSTFRLARHGALVLVLALAVVTLIGMGNARSVPIERKASVRMAGLPIGTRPTRIALLSDIHIGNRGDGVGPAG